ncbi:MAG: type II secretion system protein [Verrucomicrobia bacterium]|nr:type II secretion system protein [Verrucomicrobiota bacterium]
MQRTSGFTLVEIMIVVAIIGVLSIMALPSFVKARSESRTATCVNNLRQMHAAKQQAAMENNWANNASAATLGNPYYMDTISSYIRGGERPMCPTGAACYYNGINVPPTCQSGIVDHVYE